MQALFLFFCIIIIALYAVMALRWLIAWSLAPVPEIKSDQQLMVSVVVAVRNEEHNIVNLMRHLLQQNYNHTLLEILISDDFSEDSTLSTLQTFLNDNKTPFSVRVIKAVADGEHGKKSALEPAINEAKGKLIITTDADCTMGPDWVSSFVETQLQTNASLITGFVTIQPDKSLFSRFQSLEFLSLSVTGAASVMMEKPLMCNGANLAFLKDAFNRVGGYSYGGKHPTGDDTFLMLSVRKNADMLVAFNNIPASIITTKPLKNIGELISQRIRWASKIKHYRERYIIMTGVLVFLTNLVLLILPILSMMGIASWTFTLVLWSTKAVVDFLLLMRGAGFAHQSTLLWLFLPVFILYPLYSLAGMLLSMFPAKYTWKDRKWNEHN